jgi:WD40 repeat protein
VSEQSTLTSVEVSRFKHLGHVDLGDFIHVLSWSLNPDCPRLLAGSVNGQAVLLNPLTRQVIRQWEAHAFGVLSGGFSVDADTCGQFFATGGQDGCVRIYRAENGEELAVCQAGSKHQWVEHLAWSKHAPLLASAAGKQLAVWQTDGQNVFTFDPHEHTIAGLGWHPGLKNQLATTTYNGPRRYEIGTAKPIRRFQWKGSSLRLYWSPDAKHVASATQDATVHVWNAKSGDDVQMPGYPTKPTAQAWNSTSRFLATGGSQDVVIWDFAGKGPAGSTPTILRGHFDFIQALTFQHQGPVLASGSKDGLIYTWNLSQPDAPQAMFEVPEEEIHHLAWSPDDTLLAAATHTGTVYFFQP